MSPQIAAAISASAVAVMTNARRLVCFFANSLASLPLKGSTFMSDRWLSLMSPGTHRLRFGEWSVRDPRQFCGRDYLLWKQSVRSARV